MGPSKKGRASERPTIEREVRLADRAVRRQESEVVGEFVKASDIPESASDPLDRRPEWMKHPARPGIRCVAGSHHILPGEPPEPNVGDSAIIEHEMAMVD